MKPNNLKEEKNLKQSLKEQLKKYDKADVKIKKEIEYITKKIYIFQGEVRHISKNNK